jgi:hypothetical protein
MTDLQLNPNNPDHIAAARALLAQVNANDPDAGSAAADVVLAARVNFAPLRSSGYLVSAANMDAMRLYFAVLLEPANGSESPDVFSLRTVDGRFSEVGVGDIVLPMGDEFTDGFWVILVEDIDRVWALVS